MNNNGYSPYMFGGSCGSGPNIPSNNFAGQSSRRDSYNVRDCMYWPASLGNSPQAQQQQQSRPNYNNAPSQSYGGMPMNMNMMLAPQMSAEQYLQQAQMAGGSDYVFHAGHTDDYGNGTGEPMQQMQQAPVKAYMSTPGDGGSTGKPVQIPCHMGGGIGKLPAVPNQPAIPCHMGGGIGKLPAVPNQPAVGYKVTVPQVPPTAPLDFEGHQQRRGH
ncbi:unnamed protein product [Allacma fusca]|uniref:Uncharacterized protein n=1 Tax=Allacma fusca TaxID=39272 RepID=A0A8J2LDG9_9HEXA|nr:unnamed protein product [Allacma fusca]